ncbi:MAG: homoserine kinase [Betaproteobacteria bacterium]|nr:homoserine kinase [Betaproteobacteria bacterium]
MSVFTPVSPEQLSHWLKSYSVGTLTGLEPILEGIENTNYFVATTQGRFVLTLFERLGAQELFFYLGLMSHLARHGIPCPAPVADLSDNLLGSLNGKPAALVTRLPGSSRGKPSKRDCAQIGALLVRMHLAGRSYGGYLENPRGPKWWRATEPKLRPFLAEDHQQLLDKELRFQASCRFPDLPRGPVHADLFRDNALFDASGITGVIDFYFAGVDSWLFDVAVCVNDWCLVDPAHDGTLDASLALTLLGAYAETRAFTALERSAWPAMLRAAALRFWLSRLHDFHLPRAGKLVHMHDPEHFRNILALRSAADFTAPWPD